MNFVGKGGRLIVIGGEGLIIVRKEMRVIIRRRKAKERLVD